jgi:hypothetical protein
MNSSEEILIEIDVDGTVKVEVKGVVGTGCEALTAELLDALGEVTSDERKPEYERQAFQTLKSSNQAGAKNIARQQ